MKNWFFKTVELIFVVGLSATGFSHGENKSGPHGGHIRMPGGFHVEIVPHAKTLDIYLLDVDFKNAVVAKSSVQVIYKNKNKSVQLVCKENTEHFTCNLPKGSTLKVPGKLIVNAIRMDSPAGPAEYNLPLSFDH